LYGNNRLKVQNKQMQRLSVIFFILFICGFSLKAQKPGSDTSKNVNILAPVTIGGDTLPQQEIEGVEIIASPKFKSRRQARKYSRLVRNVKKVYPYALYIKIKIDVINEHLKTIQSEKEKKKYIKEVQKEMMTQFEDDVRHMTFSQGRILIKLIDRETGASSYEWLKEYKGDFFAGFWQTVARIFSSNLKAEFGQTSEDMYIEQIIRMIDAGVI
jgi:hypothetical protein